MNLSIILLFIIILRETFALNFAIICRKNCAEGSQINAHKETEILGECIEGCSPTLKYQWDLLSSPTNVRQTFDHRTDTYGSNTSFLTIKANVLRCGENYDLTLTVKYGNTWLYVIAISMAKCSRKYPPGEQDDESQFEDDYSDFDYVEASQDDEMLSESDLWDKINDATSGLKLMYNKSGSFSVPKKQVEILKHIELTKCSNTERCLTYVNYTAQLGLYGRDKLASVIRKTLQIGHGILNRTAKEIMKYPPSIQDYSLFVSHTSPLLLSSKPAFNIDLDQLTDHRPNPTNAPQNELDPQEETVEYPDYNDFDLVYKKRKTIMEDIMYLRLDILKLLGLVQVRANYSGQVLEMLSGTITSAAEDVPETMYLSGIEIGFSKKLETETKSLFNKTGIVLIKLIENFFWARSPDSSYSAGYVGIGSRFEPYILKNVANPFLWKVSYDLYFKSFYNGYLYLSDFILEDWRDVKRMKDISELSLGIHELYVELPMRAMVIQVENVADYAVFKMVVRLDRRPKVADFFDKKSYVLVHDTYATFIPLEASPGSRIFLSLMPTDSFLKHQRSMKDDVSYKLIAARLDCVYIDEKYQTIDPLACSISRDPTNQGFYCSCTKTGLYQFAQNEIRSTYHRHRHPTFQKTPLNVTPTITLVVVGFLYIIALISKKIHRQNHVIIKRVQHLMDNNLLDKIPYVLVVSTRSTTTANIGFQLRGSESSSPAHLLRGQSEPVLQSNVDDWFYLLTDKDLGELQSLEIWSDCYGIRPSWFCSKIKVINQTTHQEWVFQINDWLTPIGRKTSKTIDVKNPEEVVYFARHVYAIKALSNHLWVKSFTKLQTSGFTFNERIHVMFSIFVVNMMLVMLLLKSSHPEKKFWHFGYLDYEFGANEFLIGCLSGGVTFVWAAVLIYFFTNSAPGGSNPTTKTFRYESKRRTISWYVMIVVLIVGGVIVISFGLFTGFVTSIVWLYTFLIGVVVCIILECFRVMIIGFVTRTIDPIILTIDHKSIEIQRDKVMRGLGQSGMRFILQKYYTKLTDEEIKEKEKFAQEVKLLRFEKSEFIAFLIFFLILFVIIMCDRDPMSYISANNIRDIFIEDKYIRKIELGEINSQKRFYRYMQQVFLPAIHATSWYGAYGSGAPARLIDFNSKMIGVARIRQTRIRNGTCKVPKNFRHFVEECHGEYSLLAEDTRDYGEFWKVLDSSQKKFDSDDSWIYKNWREVKAVPFIGELAVYPGGGYTIKFGRTWSNSRIIIRYIKNSRWIDERTRAIFLDVNFYNANNNLFNFLTIAIEQSATGAFITNYQLNTLRFLHHDEIISRILPFLWLSLSVFLVVFSWSKYYQYKEFYSSNYRQLLKNFWNVVDLLIILLILILLITLGIKYLIVEDMLEGMKSSTNDFVSYYNIIFCQKTIEVLTAILVTLSTIRLWKLLRFLRQFRLFELTLGFSAKYLLSMMVINVLLILVYAVVGFLLLGPYVKEFRTIWSSFVALMLISFGMEFNLGLDTTHQTMYSYVGYIYFAGYLILVLVLLNIFITIIVVGYNNSKEYLDHQTPEIKYNILDFLKDDWSYNRSKSKGRIRNLTLITETNKSLKNFRLRAGQDLLQPKINIRSTKLIQNSQSMIEMHQLADKATTLIQEKYRYTGDERHEQALKTLGHYYFRFSEEDQPKTTRFDEYLVVKDADLENVYCSVKRQKAIKTIVEYLLERKELRTLETIQKVRELIQGQMDDVMEMRINCEGMIKILEGLLKGGCRDKTTQVTFEDLGVSRSSSFAESSDVIEMEFLDGNIEVFLNV